MKNLLEIIKIVTIISLTYQSSAHSASFDCANAITQQEKMICSNQKISELDEKLSSLYKIAKKKFEDDESLRAEQLAWMKETRKCKVDEFCITEAYITRIKILDAIVNPISIQQVQITEREKNVVNEVPKVETVDTQIKLQTNTETEAVVEKSNEIEESVAIKEEPATEEVVVKPFLSIPYVSDEIVMKIQDFVLANDYRKYGIIGGTIIFILLIIFLLALMITRLAQKILKIIVYIFNKGKANLTSKAHEVSKFATSKARELNEQAKTNATKLSENFNKEGGIKDNIKDLSSSAMSKTQAIAKDLSEEAKKINQIKNQTLVSNNGALTKKQLALNFWNLLSKKQKLIIVGFIAIFLAIISNLTGGAKALRDPTPEFADPKIVGDNLGMSGVSKCLAISVIWSAGLVNAPNIEAEGPEIKNISLLMQFYGDARKKLIFSMENPNAEKAFDHMAMQWSDHYSKIVKFDGWSALEPITESCWKSALR